MRKQRVHLIVGQRQLQRTGRLILPDGQISQSVDFPVQSSLQKYFASPFARSSFIDSPSRPTEGRCARHGRGAGCGGRFGAARRAAHEADGEVVWS
jgi:hypothetical protein